jgi:DHA2 family multidrug resistance protein
MNPAASDALAGPTLPRNPWPVAMAVLLATFMVVLNTSVVVVAMPYVAGNLGATADEATWVMTSYLAANAIVLPASAWFARFFGRKRFLLACIALFTVASVACGLATTMPALVLARVLQGIGGGALQPLSQSILLESFPPAKRGEAMAIFGIGTVIAPTVGPALGGWFTDMYTWRWMFYVNLPVGLLSLLLIATLVKDPPYIRAGRPKGIDGLGFSLMAIWLATLQISLDRGEEVNWFAAVWLRWFLGISAVAMVAFIVRELCAEHPIVDLRILKNRNFAVSSVISIQYGVIIFALITLQPMFVQELLGYNAYSAGLTVVPRGLGQLAALFLVGYLVERLDQRKLLAFGFVVMGFGCLLLSRMTLQMSMNSIVPANLINGFGQGFIFVPLTTLAIRNVRNEQMGNATCIYNLLRNLGGGIGLSLLSTYLVRFSQMHQAQMAGHMSPLNPVYQQRLATVQGIFATRFNSVDAQARAHAFMYQTLQQQADYWSYMNEFYVIAWLCVVCFVGVLFFKKVPLARAAADVKASSL